MATKQYIQNFLDNLGYFRDRTVDTVLGLPYDLDDVKIKPNDLVLADAFNTSLTRLYHNMLYLISNTGFANNMTPQISWEMRDVYQSVRERNSWTLQWPEPQVEYKHNTDVVVDMITARSRYIDEDSPAGLQYFCTITAEKNKDNTSSITLISNDPECHGNGSYSVLNSGVDGELVPGVWSSNIVDEEREQFKFKNIKSICIDSADKLYVLDDNIIYQYNIDGVLNRDLSLLRENMRIGRKLTNTLGVDLNTGGKTNKFGFENPKKIITQHVDGEEFLYVIDDDKTPEESTTLAIKKYDLSMNWKDTYIIDDYSKTGANTHNIVDIIPYDYFSHGAGFLAVTSDHQFITYDSEFNVIAEHDGGSEDTPKRLHVSKENTNIIYVQTQEVVDSNGKVLNPGTIQKRYVSNLPDTFATFEDLLVCSSFGLEFLKVPIYSDVSGNADKGWEPWAMRCVDVVLDEISGLDIIYISYSTNTNGTIKWNYGQDERIVCIAEGENVIHNLFVDYEQDLYELDDIHIDKEEFVNSQTYNKTIAKIVHNLMTLDANVKGKFEQFRLTDVDKQTYNINTSTVLNGLVYRNEFELSQLPGCDNDLSTYVGVNEIVSSAVLNRCIEKMYCWLNRLKYKIDLYDGDSLSRKFALDGELITCEPVIPPTPTPTVTPTMTPTMTVTPTMTPTCTITPTPTVTPTASLECPDGLADDKDRGLITDNDRCIVPDPPPSMSITPTVTPTVTNTPTVTVTATPTVTPTITPTPSKPATLGTFEVFQGQANKINAWYPHGRWDHHFMQIRARVSSSHLGLNNALVAFIFDVHGQSNKRSFWSIKPDGIQLHRGPVDWAESESNNITTDKRAAIEIRLLTKNIEIDNNLNIIFGGISGLSSQDADTSIMKFPAPGHNKSSWFGTACTTGWVPKNNPIGWQGDTWLTMGGEHYTVYYITRTFYTEWYFNYNGRFTDSGDDFMKWTDIYKGDFVVHSIEHAGLPPGKKPQWSNANGMWIDQLGWNYSSHGYVVYNGNKRIHNYNLMTNSYV